MKGKDKQRRRETRQKHALIFYATGFQTGVRISQSPEGSCQCCVCGSPAHATHLVPDFMGEEQ